MKDDAAVVGIPEISPSSCPEGYRGYSYRECSGGVLGEVSVSPSEHDGLILQ